MQKPLSRMKTTTKEATLVLQTNDVKNSVKSFQLSKKYVKRLMKIAILNIAYNRINVPESEFEQKEYEKIHYVVFKRKSQNKFIRAYHSIGHGIIDAIDKDYLKEVSLHILRKETRETLETYNIKVKYNKEETKSDQKPAKVKEATTEFLKALTELPGKKWDEEGVELFTELSYNDETPKEYEPPNFEAAHEVVPSQSRKFVCLGKMNTGFHKMSAWGRGPNFSDSRASTPAPSVFVEEEPDALLDEDIQGIPEEQERENMAEETGAQSKKRKLDNSVISLNTTGEYHMEGTISSYNDVNCLCSWVLPENYQAIRCSKCYDMVHLACHGYINREAVDEDSFACFNCSNLVNVDKESLGLLMKLRIILYGISINNSLPKELQLARTDEKSYILGQLEKLGIRKASSTSLRDVDMKALKSAIQLVFQAENSQYLE